MDDTDERTRLRKRRSIFGVFGAVAGVFVDRDRPVIFDILFWSILALTYVFRLFDPMELDLQGSGLALMTLVCVALVAVWLVLPWSPSASRTRKLAAPAFLVAATATLFTSDLIWAAGLFPIAFANGVFLFGLRRGVILASATLLALFGTSFFRSTFEATRTSPEIVVQRFALISLLTIICLGLSAAVIQARRSRERARSLLSDLEDANAELTRYAERVRELTLSEERARIAREMHDSVGHHLTAVRLQTEAALKTAEKRPDQAQEQIQRARDLAAEAFEEVRRSVRALKPPTAGEKSGAGALRALVRGFDGTSFDVSLRIDGEERGLPEEAELTLYRALQESLTNAARHSGARRVHASVAYAPENVRLTVTDDGRGAPEGATGGFGLSALAERVEALGGAFSAKNDEGGGFTVEVKLPTDGASGGASVGRSRSLEETS